MGSSVRAASLRMILSKYSCVVSSSLAGVELAWEQLLHAASALDGELYCVTTLVRQAGSFRRDTQGVVGEGRSS